MWYASTSSGSTHTGCLNSRAHCNPDQYRAEMPSRWLGKKLTHVIPSAMHSASVRQAGTRNRLLAAAVTGAGHTTQLERTGRGEQWLQQR
jgi:hypothetical protein